MELAEGDAFTEEQYQQALIRGPQLAGPQGIDATLAANNVQAIVAPTNTPAWPTDLINGDAFLFGSSGFAAVAGYPLVTVTGGFAFDLPVGITFMASAWSEPTLIKLASGFEIAADVRRRPKFLRTFNPDGRSRGHSSSSHVTTVIHVVAQVHCFCFWVVVVAQGALSGNYADVVYSMISQHLLGHLTSRSVTARCYFGVLCKSAFQLPAGNKA